MVVGRPISSSDEYGAAILIALQLLGLAQELGKREIGGGVLLVALGQGRELALGLLRSGGVEQAPPSRPLGVAKHI